MSLPIPYGAVIYAKDYRVLANGELNSAEKEWTFQGIKRCDGIDPEGNVFQVQEVPARTESTSA